MFAVSRNNVALGSLHGHGILERGGRGGGLEVSGEGGEGGGGGWKSRGRSHLNLPQRAQVLPGVALLQ